MTALAQVDATVPMADRTNQFETLFDQYWMRRFHFALQMVGNPEDAMDIAQDAFLRLHRSWDRRDPDRPFAPWFFSIVRNLAIDRLRKRGSLREAPAEAAPERDPRPAQLRPEMGDHADRDHGHPTHDVLRENARGPG